MKLSNRLLCVVVNPFAAPLDPMGRATALVARDPEHPSGARYIGARTSAARVERPGNLLGDKAKVTVLYDLTPVKVEDTAVHRAQIASGEVFDAEKAQESLCGAGAAALAESALPASIVFAAWEKQGLGSVAKMLADAENKGEPS